MDVPAGSDLLPRRDQPLMDGVELIGARGDHAAFDRLFEPGPLKDGGFEQRSRRIRIVFEQLGRTFAVECQVEPAVEAAVVPLPALRDQAPERFGNLQAAQISFVADRAAGKLQAHRVDLAGRRLDAALDLVEREAVIGALVPIAVAVDGVEDEAALRCGFPPVVALQTGDALHIISCA
ncbi:hypothetical protein ABIF81_000521 [Bradyrhizobium daqingense]